MLKLGKLFEFKNGLNSDKAKYGSGEKFINVLDIINNSFITYENIIGSVEVTETEFEKNEVTYGDILFQRSSETREEVGQTNVYLDRERNAVFGGFVIRGKKKVDYDPMFINYLLGTWLARKEITTKSGGSTRYNVGQETLRNVTIFTTSIPEQQKIAGFLSLVDKKIQQLTRKKELLEQYKKGVMQKLFSRETRFKDEKGKDYPEWEEKRLGDVSKKKSSSIAANALEESNGEYPVYGASGYIKDIVFFTEENEYIGIVKDGAGVGRNFICAAKTSVLGTLDVITAKKSCNLYFLFLLLQRVKFSKYINGSTIPHIYFKDYSKEMVIVPYTDEQEQIADFISHLGEKIEKTGQQMGKTQSFKKGLLQQMFV